MSEFSDWEECAPVILFPIDKVLEVSFDPLVHTFTLSVSSGVVGCTEVLFDVCALAYGTHEISGESGVPV